MQTLPCPRSIWSTFYYDKLHVFSPQEIVECLLLRCRQFGGPINSFSQEKKRQLVLRRENIIEIRSQNDDVSRLTETKSVIPVWSEGGLHLFSSICDTDPCSVCPLFSYRSYLLDSVRSNLSNFPVV